MADSPTPSTNTESPSPAVAAAAPKAASQEFWALVALGSAALVCVTLLAVGLALVLRGNSSGPAPIQISNIGNSTGPALPAAAGPAAPGGIQRPSEPAKPKGERASAMDRTQPALPGVLATPTPPGGQRQMALTRADPPSPPSPLPQPTADPRKVLFRMRADPNSLYAGQKPLPMPVRYNPGAVYASRDTAKDPGNFSYSPDVPFAESGLRGASLDIQLTDARKTAVVDGYRAVKGFQFFTSKLRLRNEGSQPLALRVHDLEVRDRVGVPYLVNPELLVGAWPEPSLAPGGDATVEVSFLVPEDAPLEALAIQESPGQTALVPLQAR